MVRKLFENWETNILRPIVVSVTTAFILFLASLSLTPVRNFLFGGLPDYPIYCVAEPYQNSIDPTKLFIDFFIINRTPSEYTSESLMAIVRTRHADTASPDINLIYWRKTLKGYVGKVDSATPDRDFNSGKGDIQSKVEGNDVRILIDHIKARAVLKVTIVVVDLPGLEGGAPILRTAKGAVPFHIEKYETACYNR
jgi:hypothetical protein